MDTSLQIRRAFDFTHDEVAINGAGNLSERQRRAITKSFQRGIILLYVSVLVFTIPIGIAIFRFIKGLGFYSIACLLPLLIIFLANMGKTVGFIKEYFHYRKNWASGKVAVFRNVLSDDFVEVTSGNHRFYLLDDKIELSEDQFKTLQAGRVYQIYYWDYKGDCIRLLSISIDG